MRTKRYYVVYDRLKMTADIYTTQIDAAAHAGISQDTLQRRIDRDLPYISAGYIVCRSWDIHKNANRSENGKKHWRKLKEKINTSNYQ